MTNHIVQPHTQTARFTNIALWTVQGLLALLFLFAGGMKLIMPIEALTQNGQGPVLPGPFLRFIGAAEVAGAFGLILPWLLGIRPELTPLAAASLLIIMIGAIVVSLIGGQTAAAVISLLVAGLLVFIIYGRSVSSAQKSSLRSVDLGKPQSTQH